MTSTGVAALLLTPVAALAQEWTFQKVVETGDTVPGTSLQFTGFETPAIDGDRVILNGLVGAIPDFEGIYQSQAGGPLEILADTMTPVPDGVGDFLSFGCAAGSEGESVLLGFAQNPGQQGIYFHDAMSLAAVADMSTPIPSGTGNFLGFLDVPDISQGNVAFAGFGSLQQRGIYVDDGISLFSVADIATSVPDGMGLFIDFNPSPSIDGERIVFIGEGENEQRGVYLADLSTKGLQTIADVSTMIPGTQETFVRFLGVDTDDGTTVFSGFSETLPGIYTESESGLAVVADTTTQIPDGVGSFVGFGASPAVSAGAVAFTGSGSGDQTGIYTDRGGELQRVIDNLTDFEGKTVDFLSVGRDGFDGERIAFLVRFDDAKAKSPEGDTEAIYVATLPEPGGLGLVAVLALLAVRTRRSD